MLGNIAKVLGITIGSAVSLAFALWGAYKIIRFVGGILLGYGAQALGFIWSKASPDSYHKAARKWWSSGSRM